ncbi:nucleotidyltransferase domain-containing protein [Prosthecobacter sp.]|uniref:nucleotidyltransferase domain-containing protein n=1 Tax=Prosthecobacter sp. TaxID=1965333 RepID=UPI003784E560
MTNNPVSERVRGALTRLEAEQNVRVLYACESGSRAWGFASHDSDYDVRFLYVHRREWYLSIESRRDVIEEPLSEELDVSGWELRKALRLLRKSNPPLLEWMKSPVVYHHDPDFTREFEELAAMFYSPLRCFAHYLHMASGNWKGYLEGRDQVSLKKYLYVFRPLLACRWIERSLGQVPMLFQELVDAVLEEPEVRAALEALLARKRAGDELSKSAPDAVLSRFIVTELARLKALSDPGDSLGDLDELDIFFRRYALKN